MVDSDANTFVQQSQLGRAVNKEDYEDAARLKVAIAAAATNDTVGQVMSYLSVRVLHLLFLSMSYIYIAFSLLSLKLWVC